MTVTAIYTMLVAGACLVSKGKPIKNKAINYSIDSMFFANVLQHMLTIYRDG